MMKMPIVRLEIDNMKYQILHAFQDHNEEIEKIVEEQLNSAIASYPFEEEIRKISRDTISEVISRSIKDYFSYGEGYKLIQELISTAIAGTIKSK